MRRKKHKFYEGQLIRVKNTYHVGENIRNKYGYILSLSRMSDEPEYRIIIQGQPDTPYFVFQAEIEAL